MTELPCFLSFEHSSSLGNCGYGTLDPITFIILLLPLLLPIVAGGICFYGVLKYWKAKASQSNTSEMQK